MKDYYEQMKNLNEDVANNFLKADRSHFTKTIVERLRLGKNVKSPVEGAGDEYGNYQKFDGSKNRVEEVNDKGYDDSGIDKFARNVEQMFQTMDTPKRDEEQKKKETREDAIIENSIKSQAVDDVSLMNTFLNVKERDSNRRMYEKF